MAKTWQKFDFGGAGLQTANLVLARRLRRPGVAYALWLVFPLGLYNWYLRAPWRGVGYVLAALAAIALAYFVSWAMAAIVAGALALFALYDLYWIDRRIVALNKTIRMEVYLGTGAAPPANYRGRYRDEDNDIAGYIADKERERAGHSAPNTRNSTAGGETPSKRAPSFAAQEALLRELAKRGGKSRGDKS